jgi:hypothetical protein
MTVLPADLKNTVALLVAQDPKQARQLLHLVLERMMAVVHRMEESILLLWHLAQYARDQQATQMAEVAERQVRDAERSTQCIRDLVRRQETLSKDWLRHDPG